jgi:hypothetical protein
MFLPVDLNFQLCYYLLMFSSKSRFPYSCSVALLVESFGWWLIGLLVALMLEVGRKQSLKC